MGGNFLIPISDFISGLNFPYNIKSTTTTPTTLSNTQIFYKDTGDLVGGNKIYDLYISTYDIPGANHKDVYEAFKSSMSYIYIGTNNYNQTLLEIPDGAGLTITNSMLTIPGVIQKSGNIEDISGEGILEFTLKSGGSGSVSGTTFDSNLKIGRDSQNLIDFATADNEIIFRVNNVNELQLN